MPSAIRWASAVSATPSVTPGTMGTPAASIRARAAVFEPMESMASAGGPMNVMPSASQARANGAFSARNP